MKCKKLVEPLLPGRYGRMDTADLDKEVAKFDQEFIAETGQPLTDEESVHDQRARRKRGRPRVGSGVKRVLITIESSLLRRSDVYANQHGLSRSALIARGLEALLGEYAAGAPKTRKRS
ncbi:MAG TPA: hypothetical protein VG013_07220 [Gemmataceae bacterium]|jgi:hypothetical protein|nr:hypothetical protein [Gemmataceae bacterium]